MPSTMGRTFGHPEGGSRHAPPLDQARDWGQPSEEDTAAEDRAGEERSRGGWRHQARQTQDPADTWGELSEGGAEGVTMSMFVFFE